MNIGDRVRETRNQIGMSREELAEKALVGYSTIRDIEGCRNNQDMRLSTLVAIQSVLNIPWNILMEDFSNEK